MDINCIITLQLKMYITKTCKSYSEVFARGKKVIDFWSTYKATYVLPIEKKFMLMVYLIDGKVN